MITSNVTGDILNWHRVSFKVGHIIKSILLSPLYITASLVASCTKAGEPQSGAGFLHKLGHHYTFPINKMIYGVFHYFCYLFLMDFHVVSYLFLRNFCGWIPGVFPCPEMEPKPKFDWTSVVLLVLSLSYLADATRMMVKKQASRSHRFKLSIHW